MLTQRQLFLRHQAQTSDSPVMVQIERAEGIYLYGENRRYVDLISGVSVSNIGHCHPEVVEAVKLQVDKYMHLMVYGEYVQAPQVLLSQKLCELMGGDFDNCYLVNSGSEAVEVAMKLAKRYSGKTGFVAMKNAYHGSTNGALGLMSDKSWTDSFEPLLPNILHIEFNNVESLDAITTDTAAVVLEVVQAEAGVVEAEPNFLTQLQARCKDAGCLIILDEVQTGFGRTGKMFGFQNYDFTPDIVVFAKGLGGGMPIGAVMACKDIMSVFMTNPVLGHITTFGGHPVSAAAALANIRVLEKTGVIATVDAKADLFRRLLQHSAIRTIRNKGLLMAVELEDGTKVRKFIAEAVSDGLLSDWFLFNDCSFRIAPPLTITEIEIEMVCGLIKRVLDRI
jgi:acetylornithine/succinyldiaminopimelate/putrescine aminotransferase